jgi:glycogen(starch) synthase
VLAQPEARDIYDQVLERCTLFFCVSEVLRQQLVEAFGHHRDKLVVLPNAVAFERMPPRREPVTELRRWLYVGRLLPHKGVARLLEAFARCAADDPGLHLTLLGGGREHDRLRARAVELGVSDRVSLPGPVPHEQVVEQMHAHDLLVHLSEYETFGMTVVEAVAAGMPVLVTRSGGPQETLAGLEGVAGALVDVGDDVEEVVTAYRELTSAALDPVRAREELEHRYSQAAVGRRLLDHYTSSVQSSRVKP